MYKKRTATSNNVKIKNATPKIVDGIKFRSNLEAYTYQQLQKYNIQATYEEVVFTILDSFRFQGEAVRKMTYTPDFVGEDFIIECKGWANDVFPIKWKLFKYFLFMNKLDSIYTLYLPKNKKQVDEVIQNILSRKNGE